jgi:membrane-bound lytic murein transglycosylase MltF
VNPIRSGSLLCAAVAMSIAVACSSSAPPAAPANKSASAPTVAPLPSESAPEDPDPSFAPDAIPAFEAGLPEVVRRAIAQPYTGDLDGMVKRRLIRVGVTYNRTNYFVDQGVERGATYEYIKLLEERINTVLKTGNLKIIVICIPMSRPEMLTALVQGKIDLAEGQLTITPERLKEVDFSVPFRRNVAEIVVTAPGEPPLASADDLSGREVFIRKSSSYYQSVLALNKRLEAAGKPPAIIAEAPENLEDDDLLEMVNAGLISTIVVDDYLAKFWSQIFTKMHVNTRAQLRTGADLAVAFRKNSPQVYKALDGFQKKFGVGTAFGNTIRKRYLQNTGYADSATAREDRQRFESLLALFRKYGSQYSVDYLLMAAQGYQESRLDNGAKSQVGAIGVMQIMPETGKDLGVGDITQLEPNIHGGVKYMRHLVDEYFAGEPMDETNKLLFAFASYNAGPGRIRQLRRQAEKRGLNPNIWFGNVERIVSERIGRETVTYVSNIFKYYIAYKLTLEQTQRRAATRSAIGEGKK